MKILRWASAAWIPLLLGLGGCAAQSVPFPHEAADGLKPGPGLLSGERGEFIIFGQAEGEAPDTGSEAPGKGKPDGDFAGEE